MKKLAVLSLLVVSTVVLTACGSKNAPLTSDPSIELTPEMSGFMMMLDGKAESVKAALTQYAAEHLVNDEMGTLALEEPMVTAVDNGWCFTMQAKAAGETYTYDLCRTTGKIDSISKK